MSTDMSVETNRRETFEKWIDNSTYSKNDKSAYKNKLAKHGFYLVGPNQTVCFHCKVVFTVSNVIDNTIVMHKIFSPDCTNIKLIDLEEALIKFNIGNGNENETENEIKSNEHETEIKEHNTELDKNNTQPKKNDKNLEEYRLDKILKHDEESRFPKYKTREARLETFKNWPKFIKQRPENLSEAGFFYTGKNDEVVCYSCGHGIHSWEVEDDPWGEHIRWYSFCDHIELNKTKEEIKSILNERRIYHPPDDEQTEDQQAGYIPGMDVTGDLSFNNNLALLKHGQYLLEQAGKKLFRRNIYKHECTKCNFNESNSVVLPCAHVVTCFDCSKKAKNCFRCDKKIKKVKKIYFA